MSARGLERRTRSYLSNNVPQIQEHGGHFEIEDVDEEAGEVTVAIGGACSGCGIAPMTGSQKLRPLFSMHTESGALHKLCEDIV